MKMTYFLVLSWMILIMGVYSCTLPAGWDGEWHDSSETSQDITITRSNNYVVGWKVTVFFTHITSWTCVDEDTSNNLLLFKSNQAADVFGAAHDIYRCIKWEKLTDFSYSYLIYANSQPNAQNKRVLVLPNSTVADISSGCYPSNGLPSAIETVVLVKKGNIENAIQNCPTPLLGSFNYSFNDGYTTYCDGRSVWDVCSNRTQMVVNYTLCSTTQFYSTGGVAYCAYSTSVGSTYYVTVVNADSTVDFTTTFRFTCYAVNSSGGFVYASDNKGVCVQNQDPQIKSATGSGTLTFSAFKTCPFTSDTTVETSSDNIGVIAGSVTTVETSSDNIGVIAGSVTGVVLLVAAAVMAGILIHKKYQHK